MSAQLISISVQPRCAGGLQQELERKQRVEEYATPAKSDIFLFTPAVAPDCAGQPFMNDFAALASSIFQPTAGQVYAELAGELAILNSNSGVYYGLDPVGARVWSLILAFKSVGEMRGILLEEYDVDAAQLENDLATLLCDLKTKGLIEPAAPGAREAHAAAQSGEHH